MIVTIPGTPSLQDPPTPSSGASREQSVGDYDPQQVPQEALPDLEDAMAELESLDLKKGSAGTKCRRRRGPDQHHHEKSKGQKGAQVFFFPNEGMPSTSLEPNVAILKVSSGGCIRTLFDEFSQLTFKKYILTTLDLFRS